MAALDGVALVVRADFDDDALMPAAIRRGVPLVVMRGQESGENVVDVVSFRKHGPCPHAPLDVPRVAAVPLPEGAASVVAGTLAAAEALHVLIGGDAPIAARAARAHHLRVPLDGGDAVSQETLPGRPSASRLRRLGQRDELPVSLGADVLRTSGDQLGNMETLRRSRLRVAERITDLIGDTAPIVRLRTFERETPGVELWAKCEFFNSRRLRQATARATR